MSVPEENWILFEGSFIVPASAGITMLGQAISVNKSYGRPMEISNEAMSFRLVTPEEVAVMKVKQKVLASVGEEK